MELYVCQGQLHKPYNSDKVDNMDSWVHRLFSEAQHNLKN